MGLWLGVRQSHIALFFPAMSALSLLSIYCKAAWQEPAVGRPQCLAACFALRKGVTRGGSNCVSLPLDYSEGRGVPSAWLCLHLKVTPCIPSPRSQGPLRGCSTAIRVCSPISADFHQKLPFFLWLFGFFSVFVGFFLSGEWGMGFIPPPTMHLSCDNSCQGDEGKSSLCENKTLLLSV